jgi:hypothetical protein
MTNNGAELHIVDPAIGELVPTIGISFRVKERGSCSLVCLGILGDCTSLVSSALVVSGDFICKLDVVLY